MKTTRTYFVFGDGRHATMEHIVAAGREVEAWSFGGSCDEDKYGKPVPNSFKERVNITLSQFIDNELLKWFKSSERLDCAIVVIDQDNRVRHRYDIENVASLHLQEKMTAEAVETQLLINPCTLTEIC